MPHTCIHMQNLVMRLSRRAFLKRTNVFDLGLIAIEPNSLKIQLADSLRAIPQYSFFKETTSHQYQQRQQSGKNAWMEHGKSLTEK